MEKIIVEVKALEASVDMESVRAKVEAMLPYWSGPEGNGELISKREVLAILTNTSAPAKAAEGMQNVESLEAHGYKRYEGQDSDGNHVIAWMKNLGDRIGFAMCPDLGDTLPYIVDLEDWGFEVKQP